MRLDNSALQCFLRFAPAGAQLDMPLDTMAEPPREACDEGSLCRRFHVGGLMNIPMAGSDDANFGVPGYLQSEIQIVRDILHVLAYEDGSLWLGMAAASGACNTPRARKALEAARDIATNCGFPSVSEWITEDVLGPGRDPSSLEGAS